MRKNEIKWYKAFTPTSFNSLLRERIKRQRSRPAIATIITYLVGFVNSTFETCFSFFSPFLAFCRRDPQPKDTLDIPVRILKKRDIQTKHYISRYLI